MMDELQRKIEELRAIMASAVREGRAADLLEDRARRPGICERI
jgi:hypothetical protein